MYSKKLVVLALCSLGLSSGLDAQTQSAATAEQAVQQDAQRRYCTVTPTTEMKILSLASNRRLVLYQVDGDRDPDTGCNYGSGTGHFRLADAVKTDNQWQVADADVFGRIKDASGSSINSRFINRIDLGRNGTLLIEAQELSDLGNTPGPAYRYTVRLSDWRLIRRQAIR